MNLPNIEYRSHIFPNNNLKGRGVIGFVLLRFQEKVMSHYIQYTYSVQCTDRTTDRQSQLQRSFAPKNLHGSTVTLSCYQQIWNLCPNIGLRSTIFYSPFHKTLPKSSLQIHWISVRFYEMGDTILKYSPNNNQ